MTTAAIPPETPIVRLLVTTSEAAKALAISPRKLWELTNRGEIPVVRIGRAVRYEIAALQMFASQQRGNRS